VAFSNRFTPLTGASPLLLTTQGYAVLYNASMPVIGPRDRANDTYAEQLVADARAAVDALVASGVADPRRIAIGGHSYGAAMAVNLLAHSNLFRMGIACSGAYNRTLTPFGFQTESRTFWQAPSMYAGTSAFWRADAIRAPLLLVHGELDNNSGTSPLQSERLFRALQGLGGRARYVNLPYEAHNYAARESVLHVVAEMLDWANRYLRDADGQPTASQEVAH
jgi:dipeptidyl aminopeptidase/acylaminoacyl peptidase